jgi:DNA-binding MarR family transcriptional regulator
MPIDASQKALTVLQAVLALGRRLRAERPLGGVTLAELSILAALRRLGPASARALASAERLQPQSLTRLIASLERQNLILRSRSDEDRRAILIALSERGRSVLRDDVRARRAWLEKAMANALSERERAQLLAGCAVMLRLAARRDELEDTP